MKKIINKFIFIFSPLFFEEGIKGRFKI